MGFLPWEVVLEQQECWGRAGDGQRVSTKARFVCLGGLVPFPDGSSELSLLLRSQVQETSLSSKCE